MRIQNMNPTGENHTPSKPQVPQIALHPHQIRTDDTVQHLQLLPRRIAPNPLYHFPHLTHVRLALASVEDDTPPRIIEDILQPGTRIRTSEDTLQMRHVDPVSRVSALVGRPSGEGAPIVVLGYFGAEEKMPFADHLPDDIDDLEPVPPGGEFEIGRLERGAQSLGRCEEVGGG